MKRFLLVIIIAALLGGSYFWYRSIKYVKEPVPKAVEFSDIMAKNIKDDILANRTAQQTRVNDNVIAEKNGEEVDETKPDSSNAGIVETMSALPESLNLKMQFYAQAPFGNWDYPWQEACEEASVLLVANTYLDKNWTAAQFNDEILKIVEWEKTRFGSYEHTTIKQTADMINEYFGLATVTYENPSFRQVQQVLNKGHLIIMTFAGKRLGNPNYRNGGPVYHAMVIKGYKEENKIITEDVGTRRGEDYVYSWGTIQNAMHDWAVPIEAGPKRMIEVLPPERAE